MNHFFSAAVHHGYLLIFLLCLAEACGLPVPAAVALVAAGAAASTGLLYAPIAVGLAVCALVLGDCMLFVLGRYMGWKLLGFLCRLSINPESCILRSAESFYKRGKVTLLFAKFVPGVNTMVPPLAGSMKMRLWQFLKFDVAGVLFYVLAYGTLGYLFRDFLQAITHGFQTASHILWEVLLVSAFVYIGYRVLLYFKHSAYGVVPRVQVDEIARMLQSEEASDILLVDVRSHGYYDPGATRIKDSIRIEPNNLSEEVKNLPRDKRIYLYCT